MRIFINKECKEEQKKSDDAAFDHHFISFYENYRLIFTSSSKGHYTNEAFKEQFQCLHGKRIAMLIKFLLSQELLAKHKEHLVV